PANFNGAMAAGPDSTPMAFDIAAVQQLYGANTSHNGGNDVYTLSDPGSPYAMSWACILDTKGIDAINYSGVFNAVIDLRPATLDDSPTGGGMPSYTWWVDPLTGITIIGDGFTIAGDVTNALPDQQGVTGVVIENA